MSQTIWRCCSSILSLRTGVQCCSVPCTGHKGRRATLSATHLFNHPDDIVAAYNSQNAVIVGDLNQHGVESLPKAVQGLYNHMNFPTHQFGGSVDPVLKDLPAACL